MVLTLAVVGIVYAALVAVRQRDFKRLVACSSYSHMGFIVLGAFAITLNEVQGSVFYMVAHGLIISGLFFMVGMLSDRVGEDWRIDDLGGLQRVVPRMAEVMLVLILASVALPGLVGFVEEFLVLLGAFQASRWPRRWPCSASSSAPSTCSGPTSACGRGTGRFRRLPRLGRDWAVLFPLLVAIVVLGMAPKPLLDRVEPSAHEVVEQATSASSTRATPHDRP